jgi:hypothetical protein
MNPVRIAGAKICVIEATGTTCTVTEMDGANNCAVELIVIPLTKSVTVGG